MIANKLMTVQLVLTIIIASQGIFYLLGATQAYHKLSVPVFSEQRVVLDNVIAPRLKVLYVLTLLTGLCTLVFLRNAALSVSFIGVLFAMLFVLADVVIALTINIPINKAFVHLNDVGQGVRLKTLWLSAIYFRGILSSLALASLLTAWVNQR